MKDCCAEVHCTVKPRRATRAGGAGTGRFLACAGGRAYNRSDGAQTNVHCRKRAKGSSSPLSDLPDTDSAYRIGIRNAAGSGSRGGKGVNSEDGKAGSGNNEIGSRDRRDALPSIRPRACPLESLARSAAWPQPVSDGRMLLTRFWQWLR
jgi:hypothetical protein